MKLIVAIVQDEDASNLISSLMNERFSVTKLASTGGFLRSGNTTLLLGVDDEKLDAALAVVKKVCISRKQIEVFPSPAMGPMGIGVLWGKMDLLNAMPPMLTGGEMIDSVSEQDAVWAPVPEKFEAGTQDAAGIFATGAALDYLVNTVGYENIQAREQALVHYLMGELMQLDFVQIIGSIYWDNHHGVVSFNVKGIHPHDVASIMDMDGVCIRAGHHCAQPLLTWLGVENLACCRASVAFYNDKADIDKFIAGLHHVWSTFNG